MAKGSSGAILTLFALVFAGPLVYLCRYIYNKYYGVKNTDDIETEMVNASTRSNDSSRSDTPPVAVDETTTETEEEHTDSSNYLLSLLGYAIGIGNVWRFPYLVGQYGGGAFVFAYLVCLFLVAMPLFMVELGLGQHTRLGSIGTMTSIAPRWRGLGWAQMGMVFVIVAYYNVLLAYSCIYVIASCVSPLPWESQGSEVYWDSDVLNSYPEGSAMGPVQWKLVVSLMVVYIGVFFAVGFGKKVLSDITWVTVLGPILLMVILFCRTVGLPGADEGIEFYLGKFDIAELYNAELWATACGQIIFSLSPGCGTGIALSSKAHPKEDVYRVCITVGLCNSAFSLFGGFAIFSILGNLAYTTDQSVAVIASQSGTGLAFISIADGITHFGSASNMMSVLFFVMLLSLGCDSTFAWLETLVAAVEDMCRANNVHATTSQIVGVLCVLLFIAGLPFCTRGGNQLLDVVDHFVGSWFLLFSCLLETIMFNVDFSWERYAALITKATVGNPNTPNGRTLHQYWRITVMYVVPIFTCALLLTEFINNAFVRQYGGGDYSQELLSVGWVVFFALVTIALSTLVSQYLGESTTT